MPITYTVGRVAIFRIPVRTMQAVVVAAICIAISSRLKQAHTKGRGEQIPDPFRTSGLPASSHFYTREK